MSTNGFESFHPEWDPRRPGTFIQRELDVTGTTQAELADRMSVSKKHLNQVIKAGASITPDFALALERALGVPARLILRMEADWRAAQLTRDARAGLAPHLSWLRNFSADSLTQNRIVDSGDDDLDRVEKLLRFFGVSDPSAFDRVWLQPQASFKRSSAYTISGHATALWLQLAVRQATEIAINAPEYDPKALRRSARAVPALTRLEAPAAFEAIQKVLLTAGVVLVYVPEIAETRLSGVSLWLPSDRPMIAVTTRYRFADSLWFTVAHEIAHVLMHLKRTTFLDDFTDLEGHLHGSASADPQEEQAHDFAQNLLLAGLSIETIGSAKTPAELEQLAQETGVHVGVLAGQYGFATQDWTTFGRLRVRADLSTLESLAS